MDQAPESFNTPDLRLEPATRVGWKIAAAIAVGIGAALLTTLATGHPAHAAPPPHRLVLNCVQRPSGPLLVDDPLHLMRGTQPQSGRGS